MMTLKFKHGLAVMVALIAPLSILPSAVSAQEAQPTIINFPVSGTVARLCSIGAVTGGNLTFALGSLIDGTTGLLSSTLSAPAKVVTGSWCNAPSTISIAALPLAAVGVVGAAPAGFTNAVNYTATAANWSTTPASFVVGAAANAAASQTTPTPNATNINVSIGTFAAAGGATLRPVSATNYSGQVTLTLAIVP
jgi:hypothetical protein